MRKFFLPMIGILLLLSACAMNQDLQVLRENDEKQSNKIEKNEKDITSLFVRLDDVDTSQKPDTRQFYQDNQQMLQKIQQLNTRIENLETEVRKLTEQAVRMQRIENELDEMKQNYVVEAAQAPAPKATPATVTAPKTSDVNESMEDYHYQQARKAYVANDLAKAAEQFREFIRKYPDHQLAANSQYWLGECYYSMDNFTAARNEFLKVVDFYSKSPKVPDALVKIALTYKQQGQNNQAKVELERLLKQYPKYERIDLVKSLLKEL